MVVDDDSAAGHAAMGGSCDIVVEEIGCTAKVMAVAAVLAAIIEQRIEV